MKHKNLREHIKFVAAAFKKRGNFYRERGLEVSPTLHTLLWQNRRYTIDVITRALLVLNSHSDDAPTLNKWRATSLTNAAISRQIIIALIQRRHATLSRLVVACEGVGSRESVRRALTIAIDLGLITKKCDEYEISPLLVEELFGRSIMRLRDPDVVEFARLVLMVNQAETLILQPKFDREDDHPMSTPLTMMRKLHIWSSFLHILCRILTQMC